MKLMVSGHRLHKLSQYRIPFIKYSIEQSILSLMAEEGVSLGYSGMASGVDLWFCESLNLFNIPYFAVIPFEGQEDLMDANSRRLRETLLGTAKEIVWQRNTWMVEKCDKAIVIFDGNKGGTHNVFQQLVEKKKDFVWINPVKERIVYV